MNTFKLSHHMTHRVLLTMKYSEPSLRNYHVIIGLLTHRIYELYDSF